MGAIFCAKVDFAVMVYAVQRLVCVWASTATTASA
jgi:hypothetical protein